MDTNSDLLKSLPILSFSLEPVSVYMCMYLIIAPVAQIIVVLSTQTGLVTSHVNQTASSSFSIGSIKSLATEHM